MRITDSSSTPRAAAPLAERTQPFGAPAVPALTPDRSNPRKGVISMLREAIEAHRPNGSARATRAEPNAPRARASIERDQRARETLEAYRQQLIAHAPRAMQDGAPGGTP